MAELLRPYGDGFHLDALTRLGVPAMREHGAEPRYRTTAVDDLPDPDAEEAEPERRESAAAPSGPRTIPDFVEKYITVDRQPFRFRAEVRNPRTGAVAVHDRTYLKLMYDLTDKYPQGCRNQIWHTGRQVEKSSVVSALVLLANGSWKRAGDVQIGDQLVAVNERTFETAIRPVTWVSRIYRKPVVRVRTRQGHDVLLGHEHPLLRSDGWTPAECMAVGDRVAVLRAVPAPDEQVATQAELALAVVLGWMVSEGDTVQRSWRFSNFDTEVRDDFERAIRLLEPAAVLRPIFDARRTAQARCVGLRLNQRARDYLRSYLPYAARSGDQRVPAWIYAQGRETRARFLNRLWGGDGHVSVQTPTKYEISYCSISRRLCRDLQAILWGFGIPTSIRSFVPTLYKGTGKVAWQIRIETQDGVNTFLREIGAFKKTDGVPPIMAASNNNRDTVPRDAAQAVIDRVYGARRSRYAASTLAGAGLRRRLKFAPTREKFADYLRALSAEDDADATRWLSTDVFWDEVEAVERLPAEECVDFTVDVDHNFVVEGFVTHNSTTQAAKAIVLAAIHPAFKTLYIAPRFDQVSVFSNQRFRPMAEDSEAMLAEGLIKPRSAKHLWQVGQKEFTNRSFFNFRSCYITADASRGISAHHLMIDEIQDIVSDNIPVLEECQSHYGWETGLRFRSYAGTPKTNHNALTRRYRESAQFEWFTRCHACSHWNYPDIKIIGKTSYICTRCGKPIDPHRDGQWIYLNAAKLDRCWGFRIPQMIVPFKTHADIFQKMTDPNISPLRFHNEVLGLAYDDGELVLTEADLGRACRPAGAMSEPEALAMWSTATGTPLFAGLDHGTGEGEHPSYTVLVIGYFDQDQVFQVAWMKRFVGQEVALAGQPALIDDLCRRAKVRYLMADWGFGAHQNARLVAEYGWSWEDGDRVLLQAMYVRQRVRARFDPVSYRYLLDRNESMASVIDAIRTRKLRFAFGLPALAPFVSDFTTIFLEYNETYGTVKYDHSDPDDAFHATSYAYFAGQQYFNRLVPPSLPSVEDVDPEDFGYDR